MRRVEICLGSSCFLKGANKVLETFLALRTQYGLENEIVIAGAFCKSACRQGVSVDIDGAIHSVPDIVTARALFQRLLDGEAEKS